MASATYTAESRPRYVERFTLTERLIHWVHATAFFVLLGSGLVLYLPSLSAAVARRPLIKDIHFSTGISWAGAILLIAVLGNRRALAQTAREIDLFDRDDGRFLTGDVHRPQGRFNAGQKVNAILTAAFATLFSSRACCSGTASGTHASGSAEPSTSTTRSCTSRSSSSSATSTCRSSTRPRGMPSAA